MQRYLLLADFDRTIADTVTPQPEHLGVRIHTTETAYQAVIDNMFGEGSYEAIGGLQNRSPLQVTNALRTLPQWGSVTELRNLTHDNDITPHILTQEINRKKLDLLVDQIGTPLSADEVWPPQMPGFTKALKDLTIFNGYVDDIQIDWGVISSGHDEFIKKTFAVWSDVHRVPLQPSVLITYDTIAQRYANRTHAPENARLSKPAAMPLALGIMEWGKHLEKIDNRGRPNGKAGAREMHSLQQHIMYVGDDKDKDGYMAHRADILFGLIDPMQLSCPQPKTKSIVIHDWTALTDHLIHNENALREGKRLDEIFLMNPMNHPESLYVKRHIEG